MFIKMLIVFILMISIFYIGRSSSLHLLSECQDRVKYLIHVNGFGVEKCYKEIKKDFEVGK